jgi:hypothetical protein
MGDGILGPLVAGGGVAIGCQKIVSLSSHWIALPMNRRFQVEIGLGLNPNIVNFYVGKRYCREIEDLVGGKS